jgi:hypothetical protein
MRKLLSVWLGLAALLIGATTTWAHHGGGLFEPEKTITVSGTVTDFQFVNPHVLVYINTVDENGAESQWAGELTSPNRLARMSNLDVKWHKDILKPGDRIIMTGHPARNGAPAMDITKIVDANGTALIGAN